MVILASSTVYGRTIIRDETGLVYQSVEEFESMLVRLIYDSSTRGRLAANAFRYVRESRMLSRHFHERYNWYRAMTDRRLELEVELRARVVGLA